jgi:hypothetical protein
MARAPLCPRHPNNAPVAPRRGHAPRRVGHQSGGGAGRICLWLAEQHRWCRKAHSEPASAGVGAPAAQRSLVKKLKGAVPAPDPLPGGRQCCAPCKPPPASDRANATPWERFGHVVAVMNAGKGRGSDGSGLEPASSADVPRAAVAADSLQHGAGHDRSVAGRSGLGWSPRG